MSSGGALLTRPLPARAVLLLLLAATGSSLLVEDSSSSISVLQLENGSLEIVPGHRLNSRVVVWASLNNNQTGSGWLQLEISSSDQFPDSLQARAAGLAEGYLTRNTISEYWTEFFGQDLCKDDISSDDNSTVGQLTFCNYMRQQIDENEAWIEEKMLEEGDRDPVWHMIRLFYVQVDGITEGWLRKTEEQGGFNNSSFDIKYGMRFINYIADVWDYVEKFDAISERTVPKASKPTCTVLVKHLPGQGELFVAHNTWHEYRAMGFRFLKSYSLPYCRLPGGSARVAGHTATMSSYAGSVFSVDDFMTLSSGLVTTETSLLVYNTELYKLTQPREQVFEPVRVMAANRLARDGREWTDIAGRYNSGTYNNQWMVVDYSKVQEDGGLADGALWVMEQLPGRTWSQDQTSVLRARGYWASYNRAFYPEVFTLSGGAEMEERYGSWFSYSETPRAKIMARDQGGVTDEASMIRLMRYNDFQHDPLALVPGCNKPIPAASIANRCDLTLADSSCSWQSEDYMVGHQPYGALDMKVTTRRLSSSGQFWAVLGPTHGPDMPPFDWRHTNLTDIPHYRPIQVFDFQPSVTRWLLQPLAAAIRQTDGVSVSVI